MKYSRALFSQYGRTLISAKVYPALAAAFLVLSFFAYSTLGFVYADTSNFTKNINYQGKLTDTSNVAVTDGNYNMEFKLYTTSSGGSPIWTETLIQTNRVAVAGGLFSVLLGSVTSLSDIDFNQPLYLSINVGGTTDTASPTWDGEMSPRKTLGTVPAAFTSDMLDGLHSYSFVRTGATSTIATSSSETLLKLNQLGSGNVLSVEKSGEAFLSVVSSGRVGVGTSTPGMKFSVQGDGLFSGNIYAANITATGTLTFSGSSNITGLASFDGGASTTLLSVNRQFWAGGTGTTTINSVGWVGVGTSTPSMALSVQGNSLISGDMTLANLTATGTLTVSGASTLSSATISSFTNYTGTIGALTATSSFTSSGALTAASTLDVTSTTTLHANLDLQSKSIINVASPTNNSDAANKAYVDAYIQGLSWKEPVNNLATTSVAIADPSPTTGDRFILYSSGATGFGSCTTPDIAEYDGASWVCYTSATGTTAFADSYTGQSYTYNGSSWVSLGNSIAHSSLTGLQGGASTEYYHLTSAAYTALTSANAQLSALQTTGSPSFTGLTVTGNSNVGTVASGVWTGTAIGDSYLTKTGNWTGTLDGYEGTFLYENSFSTTSADYFTSINVNAFIHGSTTIPKTYTANTFTALQTLGNASTTRISSTNSAQLAVSGGYVSVGTSTNPSSARLLVEDPTVPFITTRDASGGADNKNAAYFQRENAYSGGTPTNNDSVGALFRIHNANMDWVSVAGLRGVITDVSSTGVGALAFSTKGSSDTEDVERMRLSGTGLLGIGTTSPYAKLSVHAYATETNRALFSVASSTASATTTHFVILNNGYVGVGTSTPTYAVDVYGYVNTDQYSGYKQAGNTILYASTTNLSVVGGPNTGISLSSVPNYSTAFGYQALYRATSTIGNTAFGYHALYGADSTAPGDASVHGSYNLAFGYNAMGNTSTSMNGGFNVAFGPQALYNNTTGSSNFAIGYNSMYNNTIGSSNVAIGASSFFTATSSGFNTAIGASALINYVGSQQTDKTSGNNTAIGASALWGDTTGINNVGIGTYAGYTLTTGSQNVILGGQTTGTYGPTTGSHNILIGYGIDLPSHTSSNQLNIGNLIYGTGMSGSGTTVSSGQVGIATSTPHGSATLDVYGNLFVEGPESEVRYLSFGTVPGSSGYGLRNNMGTVQVRNSGGSWVNIPTSGTTQWTTSGDNIYYNTGNVSVGSTTPWAQLSVNPNGLGVGVPAFAVGSSTKTQLLVNNAGLVGIGTSSPWGLVSVDPNGLATDIPEFVIGSSTATHLLMTNRGYLGIGATTTPGSLFSVNGITNFTTATSTFYGTGGINISDGCFALDGTCITGSWSSSGSDTYYNLGNVGIGTTSPYAKLSVVGAVVAEYFVATSTDDGSSFFGSVLIGDSTPTTVEATYSYTGSTQTFVVPAAVTSVEVKMWGGGGAAGDDSYYGSGGYGGGAAYAAQTVSTVPGEAITITVAGGGTTAYDGSAGTGGFGGGGNGGSGAGSWEPGGGGGGASKFVSTNAVVVAAGGGGGSTSDGAPGAPGGAATASDGSPDGCPASYHYGDGGGGATQSSGGSAGASCGGNSVAGTAGGQYQGGDGGSGIYRGGGGGGGGYYGGGGGASGEAYAGGSGGGGSSYATTMTAGSGVNPGNASDPDRGTAGNGGSSRGASGANGLVVITYSAYLGNVLTIDRYGNLSTVGDLTVGGNASTTNLSVSKEFWAGGTGTTTITTAGWVGVGTSTPAKSLSVQGGALFSGNVSLAGLTATGTATLSYASTTQISSTGNAYFATTAGGLVGIGTSTPWAQLSINPDGLATDIPEFVIGSSTATHLLMTNRGYLGIGATTTPGSLFSVNGITNFTTATSTFYGTGGINISDGCFAVDGTCISSGGGSWTLSGSDIYYTAGNVGVGTSSPYTALTVGGEAVAFNFTATSSTATSTFLGGLNLGNGEFSFENGSGNTYISSLVTGAQSFDYDAGAVAWIDMPVSSTTIAANTEMSYTASINNFPALTIYGLTDGYGSASTTRVGVGTTTPYAQLTVWGGNIGGNTAYKILEVTDSASTTLLSVVSTGYVAVGATTTPGSLFSVNGITNFTTATSTFYGTGGINIINGCFAVNGTCVTGSSASSGVSTGWASTTDITSIRFTGEGNVGVGSSTPWAKLSVDTSSLGVGVPAFAVGSSSATRFIITNKGYIGVGTTTPGALFAVHGSALFSGNLTATGTTYLAVSSGNVGVGTSTVYSKLSVWGGDSGGNAIGRAFEVTDNASTTLFAVDNSGTTTIPLLDIGAMGFDYDVGAVSWMNMPTATSTAEIQLSYSAQIADTDILTIFASTTGELGIINAQKVIIGTTSEQILGFNNGSTTALIVSNGYLCVDNNATCSGTSARVPGTISAVAALVSPTDLAERFPSSEPLEPGTLVAYSTSSPVLLQSASSRDALVGIVTTKPGLTLGSNTDSEQYGEHFVDLALSGRVPARVNLEGGEIKIGDRITISSEPGVGMKANSSGQVVGIALEGYNGEPEKNGRILVFVSLGYQKLSGDISGDTMDISSELDMNEHDIVNVRKIISNSGQWSIDETGKLTVDTLEVKGGVKVGSPDRRSGITLYDEVTGDPYCLKISNGAMVSSAGECGGQTSSSQSQTTPSVLPTDTEAPVIHLIGNATTTLNIGDSYVDPGATVTDNLDHNLGVHTEGTVDTGLAGEYTLTYTAEDSAGNEAIPVNRVVTVASSTTP